MPYNSTTCSPPLRCYSSAPSIISPPVPLQSSTQFVHANVGVYNHLIVFGFKKRLELVGIGQMGMDGNKRGDTEWEALSVAIFTIHGPPPLSSGFSIVTSTTLLHHLSGMVDTLPTGRTAHLTS